MFSRCLLLLAAFGLASASVAPELYLLATEWPQSSCEMHDGGCSIAANVSTFTIHGLWPDVFSGDSPQYCQGEDLDMEALQPLLSSLLQLWPNVYAGKTAESFWEHEWDKHGKCAVASGDFESQEAYFSFALTQVTRYNAYQILAQAGIGPSDQPQNLTTILNVLDETFYYRFNVVCQKQGDRFLLSEVQVCFNTSQKPVDCYIDDDHSPYHVTGCSGFNEEPLFYLPIEH